MIFSYGIKEFARKFAIGLASVIAFGAIMWFAVLPVLVKFMAAIPGGEN